jgi:Holliday junction resolvase RusA-like endonuclease
VVRGAADPDDRPAANCAERGHGAAPSGAGGLDQAGAQRAGTAGSGERADGVRAGVHFTIPGAPIGKGRPIAGKSFAGFTTLRTPSKTVKYESEVRLFAAQAMGGRDLIDCAVAVRLAIYCAIPKSMTKKDRLRVERDELRPTTKPDLDNVVKAIFDGMNGVVWKDDVQVVDAAVSKRFSDNPRVIVTVVPA